MLTRRSVLAAFIRVDGGAEEEEEVTGLWREAGPAPGVPRKLCAIGIVTGSEHWLRWAARHPLHASTPLHAHSQLSAAYHEESNESDNTVTATKNLT